MKVFHRNIPGVIQPRSSPNASFATLPWSGGSMNRLALTIVFVLGLVPSAWADFQAGVAAHQRGDFATALREFKLLAEQGDASAQFNLSVMYDNGEGAPQDYVEMLKWNRKAAEQGNASAQFKLGVMYDNGEGAPQDDAEALKWYRRAAEQGQASVQNKIGLIFDSGGGVPQDDVEALKGFGRSVPQSDVQTLSWYRNAAEQGNVSAQSNLGNMYGKGDGIPQDFVQAHKWHNLVASRLPPGEHRDLAVKNRDIAAAGMTAAQIAEAQRLAREWKPKKQVAKAVSNSLATPPAATSETKSIQTSLATLGYDPGPADGFLGSRTKRAIEAFQRNQGLPVTGEVSAKLRRVLDVAIELLKKVAALDAGEPLVTGAGPAALTSDAEQREANTDSGSPGDAGGTIDDGTSDDGTSDGGTTDDGTSDGGTSDDGTSDGGTSDDGTSDDGTSDGGTTGDGTSDDGNTDDGTTDDPGEFPGNSGGKGGSKGNNEGQGGGNK